MRCLISVILVSLVLSLTGPAAFASRYSGWSFYKENLEALIKLGRAEFNFTQEVCDRNSQSTTCAWAQWRLQDIENEILSNPVFPKNYQPSPFKKCLYVSMVACSLLGGPDPEEQGLAPWSSLSGQELDYPIDLYRKQAAESGANPKPGRNLKSEH